MDERKDQIRKGSIMYIRIASIIFSAVLLFSSTDIYSKTVLPRDMVNNLHDTISMFKSRILDSASSSEKKRLLKVKFNLIEEDESLTRAIAIPGDNPQIQISTGFLAGLRMYVDSIVLSVKFNKSHLEGRYFTYSSRLRNYNNKHLKSLEEYAKLTSQEMQIWNYDSKIGELRETLFLNAVFFVLAHEMGHHAKDAFYKETNNNIDYYNNQEEIADTWACSSLLNIGIPPAVGAAVANGYIYELDRYNFMYGKESYHPPSLERSLKALDLSYSELDEIYSNKKIFPKPLSEYKSEYKKMRKMLVDKIEIDKKSKDISSYKYALDKGSPLAAFIIARMYDGGIGVIENNKQAFAHYMKASSWGYELAYYWVGDCFERGIGTQQNNTKALKWYKRAADVGLYYGEYRYKHLKQRLNN